MRRYYQREVHAPPEIPLALRERLHKTGWTWAEKFARNEILDQYRPKIATALAQDYMAVAGDTRQSWYEPAPPGKSADSGRWANSWNVAQVHVKAQHRQLQMAKLNRAFDEQEIRDYAENYARQCSKMSTYQRRVEFVKALGIKPPEGPKVTVASATKRMDDTKWWRRQLRVTWTRRAENVMRELGIVRRGREAYASDDAVNHRRAQKERGRQFLEKHVAVSDKGEQLSLWDLHEGSVSNPAIRRGEFMCRVRGFEETADRAGHVALFWTLTAPSKFHATHYNGEKNAKFTGASPRDAQDWLCKMWSRVRAKLKRLSLLMYGVRVAEPHHDATPHWHLLLFVRPADAATIAKVVEKYWLSENADELGTVDPVTGRRPKAEARCKLITIDRAKGSAVGYVAKYVAKNIDGAGSVGPVEDNETGATIIQGVARVDAWASLHGIRQFQQIGGPPVGLWRELRRMTEPSEDRVIESVRAPADTGDWRTFIRNVAYEGIRATRRNLYVKLARAETGELTTYGEEPPPRVIGVRGGAHVDVTRPHMWRIQSCSNANGESTGPVPVESATPDSPALRNAWMEPESPSADGSTRGAGWSGNLHPYGALCGLRLGDSQRRADECAVRRMLGLKTRTRRKRAAPAAVAPAPGSFSWDFSNLGPVAITVRGSRDEQSTTNGPAAGPNYKGGP